MSSLVLIGCGAMGSALLKGWLASSIPFSSFSVIDPFKPSLADPRLNWSPSLAEFLQTPSEEGPTCIVLATKPQDLLPVLKSLAPIIEKETLVLSIAAGKTLAWFAEHLPPQTALIRAMPNLAALYKKGVTGILANSFASKKQMHFTTSLFSAVGEAMWLNEESQFDLITALSGGGPAYFCYLVELLSQIALAKGLQEEEAKKLARQTLIGSAALLENSQESAGALREKVTSKGGTTFEALAVLKKDQALYLLLKQAIEAAMKRSQELNLSV